MLSVAFYSGCNKHEEILTEQKNKEPVSKDELLEVLYGDDMNITFIKGNYIDDVIDELLNPIEKEDWIIWAASRNDSPYGVHVKKVFHKFRNEKGVSFIESDFNKHKLKAYYELTQLLHTEQLMRQSGPDDCYPPQCGGFINVPSTEPFDLITGNNNPNCIIYDDWVTDPNKKIIISLRYVDENYFTVRRLEDVDCRNDICGTRFDWITNEFVPEYDCKTAYQFSFKDVGTDNSVFDKFWNNTPFYWYIEDMVYRNAFDLSQYPPGSTLPFGVEVAECGLIPGMSGKDKQAMLTTKGQKGQFNSFEIGQFAQVLEYGRHNIAMLAAFGSSGCPNQAYMDKVYFWYEAAALTTNSGINE